MHGLMAFAALYWTCECGLVCLTLLLAFYMTRDPQLGAAFSHGELSLMLLLLLLCLPLLLMGVAQIGLMAWRPSSSRSCTRAGWAAG